MSSPFPTADDPPAPPGLTGADSTQDVADALAHPHAAPAQALHDVFVPPAEERRDDEASTGELLCYGAAEIGNAASGTVVTGMVNPILNITLGVSPGLIGVMLAVKSFWEAFTDPAMGYVSDNWRKGKWGRRRGFIGVAGVLMTVFFIALWSLPAGLSERGYLIYFGVGLLLFSTAHTMFSAPYYALGIELSPHYHGRTRVVVYRGIFSKLVGFAGPWFFPFCLLPIFRDARQGVFVLALIVGAIVLVTTLLTAFKTRERTGPQIGPRENFWHAIWGTISNVHFLKITAIWVNMIFLLGVFSVFGGYIVIYYVFAGDVTKGATYQAIAGSLGSGLAMLSIPFVAWLSRRYEKHNALRIALVLMIMGSLLNMVCLDPRHPNWQFVIPFFYSLGISCVFTILGSMQADVVDVDELRSDKRREGMFGAAAGYFMKFSGAIASAMSGFALQATGFDVKLGGHQGAGTILAMRLLYSVAPAILMLICFALLYRYPLTETYIESIKPILEKRRRERATAALAADTAGRVV